MQWKLLPPEQFSDLAETWDNINEANYNSPVLESRFIQPLLTEFGTGNELIACCSINNSIEAILVLERTGFGVWSSFQPSQSPLGCFIFSKQISLVELCQSLIKAVPGVSLNLGLTQLDPALVERPLDQLPVTTLDYIQTARVSITESFDEYWAKRGKNLRQNLKRQRNRLGREETETRLETITNPDLIKQAIADYGELESAGWKSSQNTAIHQDNSQGRYYTKILQNYCGSGDGRIFRYWYDDKLVAIDLCIIKNGTIVILKTTYDENQKTSSPALLMRQESFEQIFGEDNIKTIEFYGKVMDWHTKWTDETRIMYHVNYFRWKLLGALKKLF